MRLACAPVWSGNSQPGGGRSPHAAAACLNAGDWRLTPGVAGMNIPPVLGNVGSGQFGTPCLRMPRAWASGAMRCASGSGDPLGRPPGCSLLHVCSADTNAGACSLIPEPGPPTGEPGSGKFGTPCERMQSANSSASVSPLPVPAALLGLPEDPQAATASTQLTAASAIDRLRRWLLGTLLVPALGMSWDSIGSADGSIPPDDR